MKNKTTTVWIEYKGIRMCLADWAKKAGIKRATLAARLKSGWSIERALTTPLRSQGSL